MPAPWRWICCKPCCGTRSRWTKPWRPIPALARLDPRDRGFARMLAATCLRRLGEIDQAIAPALATPLPAKASAVADALRLGACQLLFLGTPPHAAVSETVELVAGLGALAGYKGLANALLRRLDRERPATDPWRNVPDWLAESWTAAYGETTARAIAAAHLVEAPLDLSVKADAEGWAERLGGGDPADRQPAACRNSAAPSRPCPVSPRAAGGCRMRPRPCRPDLLGTAAPRHRPLRRARAARRPSCCRGGHCRHRRRPVAPAAAAAEGQSGSPGLAAAVVEADAPAGGRRALAEAVLLDAPCSATGTIRRHPDLPWLKNPEDLPKLTALQDRLLDNAVAMTQPGGVIVYAVCSLQPEEGLGAHRRLAGPRRAGRPHARSRPRRSAAWAIC